MWKFGTLIINRNESAFQDPGVRVSLLKNDKVSKLEISASFLFHRYMVITIYIWKVEASSFRSGSRTHMSVDSVKMLSVLSRQLSHLVNCTMKLISDFKE